MAHHRSHTRDYTPSFSAQPDEVVSEGVLRGEKPASEKDVYHYRNVSSSIAGAGSGDFHTYRALRRHELDRVKRMETQTRRDKRELLFQEKIQVNAKVEEEKLEKSRAARMKKKELQKKRRAQFQQREAEEKKKKKQPKTVEAEESGKKTVEAEDSGKREADAKKMEAEESCKGEIAAADASKATSAD